LALPNGRAFFMCILHQSTVHTGNSVFVCLQEFTYNRQLSKGRLSRLLRLVGYTMCIGGLPNSRLGHSALISVYSIGIGPSSPHGRQFFGIRSKLNRPVSLYPSVRADTILWVLQPG